ncbi:hypothetical protein [Mucilaginibacter sp.]|uniref:hypothetical protein n=1 Tax=Mucilaginibacter sp. TaxID=1882438 RepID=UPI0025E0CCAC|nr:hypothetical protein [Mucilaginibacter sp.]
MNKIVLLLLVLLLLASCSDEDKEIHIIKNFYLIHNGDDPSSGLYVGMKTNDNNYDILIDGEDIKDVYTDSTQIFIKTVFNNNDTSFYKIKLNTDTLKRPLVTEVLRKRFEEGLADCSSCKKLKFSL